MNASPTAQACLRPYRGRGLFVTATGTGVGKTVVTAALAGALRRLRLRVGICKPVTTGCPPRAQRIGDSETLSPDDPLEAPDSILPAQAAGHDPTDVAMLSRLAPIRFAAAVSPHIAAAVEGRAADWRRVAAALEWWADNCDVLLVEGSGGWYVPLDEHDFMIADLATALRLPVLVVTSAALGTLNHTLLTVRAVRERHLEVAGLILNRVPEEGRRDLAIRTNVTELPRLTGVPVQAVLPELAGGAMKDQVPDTLVDAMLPFARERLGMACSR